MNPEPRHQDDYSDRQVEAARRVLIDLGQVLASFTDCMVVVGGWVPDLLIPTAAEPHVGSIDVDVALDTDRLGDGRYAEMLKLLLDTKRYRKGQKEFQLVANVDLGDAEPPVQVELEFLAQRDAKLKKNRPKLLAGFRILQIDGCQVAFHSPIEQVLSGRNVRGAENTVRLLVASLADFLLMKALAIGGRDKPKDSYDLCFTLDHLPGGIESIAEQWKSRATDPLVIRAVHTLREKFAGVDAFGPQQVVEFRNAINPEESEIEARRAFELVQRFLSLLDSAAPPPVPVSRKQNSSASKKRGSGMK